MRPKIIPLLAIAFLLSACDSSGPVQVTPSPVQPAATATPRPWGELPTPPVEISKTAPDILVTLTHEQGATLFPARVLDRANSSRPGFQAQTVKEIIIVFEVKNNTGHDIEKVAGPLLLYDASGADLESDRVEATPPIKAGESITQSISFTDIADMASRKKLKEIPLDQIQAELRPTFVTYTDGTGQEIKYSK